MCQLRHLEASCEYSGLNRMVYSEITDLAERTRSIGFYGYDALGRRTLTGNGLGRTIRAVYDGFSFEIIREGETFLDGSLTAQYSGSAGTRAAGTGVASGAAGTVTGERYRWLGESIYGGTAAGEDGYRVTGSLNGARGGDALRQGRSGRRKLRRFGGNPFRIPGEGRAGQRADGHYRHRGSGRPI